MSDFVSRAAVEAALNAEHKRATAEYTEILNGGHPYTSALMSGVEMNLCARLLCAIRAIPAHKEGFTHCAQHNVDYPTEDGCAACRPTKEEEETE